MLCCAMQCYDCAVKGPPYLVNVSMSLMQSNRELRPLDVEGNAYYFGETMHAS